MTKGDIILIIFPFTDLTGKKLRPAVVLVSSQLDVTVSFITTQISWKEATDVVLLPSAENGIRKQSLVRTSKIATLDKSLAKGLLGRMNVFQIGELNKNLIALLQLG